MKEGVVCSLFYCLKNFGLDEVVLTCEGFVVICVLCWDLKTPELVLFDFSIVDVVYTINSLHLPS